MESNSIVVLLILMIPLGVIIGLPILARSRVLSTGRWLILALAAAVAAFLSFGLFLLLAIAQPSNVSQREAEGMLLLVSLIFYASVTFAASTLGCLLAAAFHPGTGKRSR